LIYLAIDFGLNLVYFKVWFSHFGRFLRRFKEIGKDSFLFYLKSLGKVLKPESFKFFYLIIKILKI